MAYTEITNRNATAFTIGRNGKSINKLIIHHWGDPNKNPTAEGVVDFFCNGSAQTSAHFVITGTGRRVWQLVNDADTAWHAGDWGANLTSLGLELDPRCRDEDYDVAAEVISNLWKYYGKLPLYPHKHFVATACPGNYDLNRLNALAESKFNGTATPPKSDKITQDQLNQLFKDLLERQPDNPAIKYYVGNLTYEATKHDIINSKEYHELQEAKKPVVAEEIITTNIPFKIVEYSDDEMLKGETKITRIGVNGHKKQKKITTRVRGVVTKTEYKDIETKEPISQMVAIGAKTKTSEPVEPETPTEPQEDNNEPTEPTTKPEEKKETIMITQEQTKAINTEVSDLLDQNEFKPVISDKVKTIAYFVTDIGASTAGLIATLIAVFGYADGLTALMVSSAVTAFLAGVKQTFRLSNKKQ